MGNNFSVRRGPDSKTPSDYQNDLGTAPADDSRDVMTTSSSTSKNLNTAGSPFAYKSKAPGLVPRKKHLQAKTTNDLVADGFASLAAKSRQGMESTLPAAARHALPDDAPTAAISPSSEKDGTKHLFALLIPVPSHDPTRRAAGLIDRPSLVQTDAASLPRPRDATDAAAVLAFEAAKVGIFEYQHGAKKGFPLGEDPLLPYKAAMALRAAGLKPSSLE